MPAVKLEFAKQGFFFSKKVNAIVCQSKQEILIFNITFYSLYFFEIYFLPFLLKGLMQDMCW